MNGKQKYKIVALDTSVLIYHANNDPNFGEAATRVLDPITRGEQQGIISAIAVTEFLSLRPLHRQSTTERNRLSQRLLAWVLNIPHVEIIPIDTTIAAEAAKLRQRYGFRTPDALHLACAIAAGANIFITNDQQLRKCKEITVKML